jgi:nucleoside-diphosphate-sugar epimerase
MRIFVTGASGFVGSAVVPELLRAGHQVVGLARSETSAAAVKAAGADVQRGDLADLDVLTRGASSADGVIHLGFIHDFANYAKSAETDRAAIRTMAEALAGSRSPRERSAQARREPLGPRMIPAMRRAASQKARSTQPHMACAGSWSACRRRCTETATMASCRA